MQVRRLLVIALDGFGANFPSTRLPPGGSYTKNGWALLHDESLLFQRTQLAVSRPTYLVSNEGDVAVRGDLKNRPRAAS